MKSSELLLELQQLTSEDLLSVKGIGDVLASNVITFINSDRYQKLINNFLDLEHNNNTITIIETKKNTFNSRLPLSGHIICITGIFEMPRTEIKDILENQGAKVVDTVTKSTTHLLAGEKAGSKLQKAKELGDITIVGNISDIFKSLNLQIYAR